MKKFVCFLLLTSLLACAKNEVETVMEDVDKSKLKVLYSGQFVSGSNPTSGKITIAEDASGVKKLYLEDLKSDSGPDLRLILAEDTKAKNAIQIIAAPKNGTYSLDLPANIDFSKNKFALIWCQRFTKLFGSAELQKN